MAFSNELRTTFQQELTNIQQAGIYKEERIIHAPQSSEIDVVFPWVRRKNMY